MSSSFASASASAVHYFPTWAVWLYSLLNVQNNSIKYKQGSLKITDFWEST